MVSDILSFLTKKKGEKITVILSVEKSFCGCFNYDYIYCGDDWPKKGEEETAFWHGSSLVQIGSDPASWITAFFTRSPWSLMTMMTRGTAEKPRLHDFSARFFP